MSWVTLLLLLALAGGGYLGFVWLPVYSEHYAVKQVVREYMNQAIKNRDDAGLRQRMVLKIRSLSEREAIDRTGQPTRVPAVALDEQQVVWDRDTRAQPPMLRVAFEYEREVELPGLDRVTTKVFAVDLTNELAVPNWGPPR